MERIECRLCGRTFGQIPPQHLMSSHGISIEKYREIYPFAPIKAFSKETLDAMSASAKVKVFSEEHRKSLSEAQIKRHAGTSQEEHERISKLISEANTGRYFDSLWRENIGRASRERSKDPEYRRRMSESCKRCWRDPEYVQAQQERRHAKPNLEEYLLGYLLERNFPEEWRYTGSSGPPIGSRIPDFTHKARKVVIELFGPYWHISKARTLDDEVDRIEGYSKLGYSCLVLWTDETWDEAFVVEKVTSLIERSLQ